MRFGGSVQNRMNAQALENRVSELENERLKNLKRKLWGNVIITGLFLVFFGWLLATWANNSSRLERIHNARKGIINRVLIDKPVALEHANSWLAFDVFLYFAIICLGVWSIFRLMRRIEAAKESAP